MVPTGFLLKIRVLECNKAENSLKPFQIPMEMISLETCL